MPVPGSPRIAHFGFPPQSHLSMHPDGRVVMPCQRLRTPCSAPVAPSLACSSIAALTRERRQFMPWRLPVTARFTVHDHRIIKTLCGVLGLLCLFRPSWLAIASPLSIEHYSSTEKLTEVARNLIPNNDGELPSLRACVSFCFITPAESATAHVVSLIRRESCCKRSLLFLLRSQTDVNSLSISSVVHGQLLTCVD
jgi:hypothetical protein